MSFEQGLARLEEIVAELHGDDVPLSRALALFEEGVQHLRAASDELQRAESRLQELRESADGTLEAVELRG